MTEISLHNSRKELGRPAIGVLLVAVVLAAFGAANRHQWFLLALGAFFGVIGALLAVLAIRYPRRLTLTRAGLVFQARRATETIPAAAIRALGVTMVGNLHLVTLWYDTALVPELPSEFAYYARHQAPYRPGVVYLACVGPPLKEEQIQSIYRFVQQENLGEWRDYPADVGSD